MSVILHSQSKRTRRRAFTLIELLVSMTILIVMTLIMTKIISDSTRAVDLGYQQAMMDGNARSFLDNILDDLSQAIAMDRMEMRVQKGASSAYGFPSDRIFFHAMVGTPNTDCRYSTRRIKYEVDAMPNSDFFVLKRGAECSDTADANVNSFPLLDYVVQFRITLMAPNAAGVMTEVTNVKELPAYAEIMLMTISDKIHGRAMMLPDSDRVDYLRRFGRRHFVQAAFPMAAGRVELYDYATQN